MSEALSSNVYTSRLLTMRFSDVDFGNVLTPRWIAQRTSTCPTSRPMRFAIACTAGSSSSFRLSRRIIAALSGLPNGE